jgi:hypothetical protein
MTNEIAPIDAAAADGIKLARGIFAMRGSNSEIHVSEEQLANMLTLAFQHGVRASINALHSMINGGPVK